MLLCAQEGYTAIGTPIHQEDSCQRDHSRYSNVSNFCSHADANRAAANHAFPAQRRWVPPSSIFGPSQAPANESSQPQTTQGGASPFSGFWRQNGSSQPETTPQSAFPFGPPQQCGFPQLQTTPRSAFFLPGSRPGQFGVPQHRSSPSALLPDPVLQPFIPLFGDAQQTRQRGAPLDLRLGNRILGCRIHSN